jgi:hypothetical protein
MPVAFIHKKISHRSEVELNLLEHISCIDIASIIVIGSLDLFCMQHLHRLPYRCQPHAQNIFLLLLQIRILFCIILVYAVTSLPPLQLPARVLEIIGSKVALYHWSEVDVQDAWVAAVVSAL